MRMYTPNYCSSAEVAMEYSSFAVMGTYHLKLLTLFNIAFELKCKYIIMK